MDSRLSGNDLRVEVGPLGRRGKPAGGRRAAVEDRVRSKDKIHVN